MHGKADTTVLLDLEVTSSHRDSPILFAPTYRKDAINVWGLIPRLRRGKI